MNRYAFFLGGADLEMEEIRKLLAARLDIEVHDAQLKWGARSSCYASAIADARAKGKLVVLVELDDDLSLPDAQTVIVDHHGGRSGRDAPTSLEQVFNLLGCPADEWTRWRALVAANDRGYVEEMLAMGASHTEVREVRRADRAAQGVSEAHEREARRAIAAREEPCPLLTIVRVGHSKVSAVCDLLHSALGGVGFRNLLVICPGETFFFGEGEHVLALASQRPCYHGGSLPDRGYWGVGSVEDYLRTRICGEIR